MAMLLATISQKDYGDSIKWVELQHLSNGTIALEF